jgi:hypothetical protein
MTEMPLLALLRTVHADLMPIMVENHQSEAQIVVFPHQSRGQVLRVPMRARSTPFDSGHPSEFRNPIFKRIDGELVEI